MFSCYGNVDELMGLYVGCFRHINGLCIFFSRKLPPTSKGEVEDGRHIDTSIRKGQDHNKKKSLSISRAESNSKSDLVTFRDMEVLSTYVRHPCDN
jgi:hypothetical protein